MTKDQLTGVLQKAWGSPKSIEDIRAASSWLANAWRNDPKKAAEFKALNAVAEFILNMDVTTIELNRCDLCGAQGVELKGFLCTPCRTDEPETEYPHFALIPEEGTG